MSLYASFVDRLEADRKGIMKYEIKHLPQKDGDDTLAVHQIQK